MKHYFLRHFQTKVDTKKPVSQWVLSEKGKKELNNFISNLKKPLFKNILTSSEKKASMIAIMINEKESIPYKELEVLRELNRDKSGYIKNNYEEIVKKFFEGKIDKQVKWETRTSLQRRIQLFLKILKKETESTLIIGHGLFFTEMLAPILDQSYFDFWSTLKFGEIIELSLEQILNTYRI